MADELLRLTGLEVHFPIRGGVARLARADDRAASSGPSTAST